MYDRRNLHAKIQELCDCFATTDPLLEMSKLASGPADEALKWIALAVLHGINANAKKITLTKTATAGSWSAPIQGSGLPSPGVEIGGKVLETLREITHLEKEKGKTPLALGVRDSSLELVVKAEKGRKGKSCPLNFPADLSEGIPSWAPPRVPV